MAPRPKKKEAEKKLNRVDIGFTAAEKKRHIQAASMIGIDVKAFYRMAIKEKTDKVLQ